MKRRSLSAAFGVASVALLAACGTRLPDQAFVQAQQQQAGVDGTGTGTGGLTGTGATPPPGAGGSGGGGSGGGGGGGGGSTSGSSSGTGTGSSGGRGSSGGGGANTASDVGVTADSITIGSIASKTNPFDPSAFVGPLYGVQAFVAYTNAHGGINGRKLALKTCDDQGSGDSNQTCVHQLVDNDKVFALVSNGILTYSAASYVNSKGVPDIGSQPIDNPYNQYPHLWDLYGEDYPRDGKQIGFHGYLYGGTEIYHFFKTKFPRVPLKAGVVEYNQSASQRFGDSIANGLQHEGYTVTKKVVNFALPDYDSVAIAFKNAGVQYVYDTLDKQGNVRLCKALDDNGVSLTAKVLTAQSWTQSVGSDYSDSPKCRDALWSTGNTRNYADTQYPEVKAFRGQMAAMGRGGAQYLSDWALEGWGGGQWFADAAASCGGKLTRGCVEKYMNTGKPYDAHGLFTPRQFRELAKAPTHDTNCLNVVRWVQSRDSWVTQVPDMDKTCYDVPNLPYKAT